MNEFPRNATGNWLSYVKILLANRFSSLTRFFHLSVRKTSMIYTRIAFIGATVVTSVLRNHPIAVNTSNTCILNISLPLHSGRFCMFWYYYKIRSRTELYLFTFRLKVRLHAAAFHLHFPLMK